MRIVFGSILVALILAGAGPTWALDWEVYPQNPGDLQPPLQFKRLVITCTDSARVAAWYIPPQEPGGALREGRHRAILLVSPEGRTMADQLTLIEGFAARGYAVLAFDHRGTGASDPFERSPQALVQAEYLEDGNSALDILWRRSEVDTLQIGAYGQGMAAAVALGVAGRRPEIRAVVAVAPPYNFKDLRESLAGTRPGVAYFVPNGWKRGDEPDKVMNRYNGAVLFVAGEFNPLIPGSMTLRLHKKYPRPKELWEIAVPATDTEVSPETVEPGFLDRAAAFLERELTQPPHRGWPER